MKILLVGGPVEKKEMRDMSEALAKVGHSALIHEFKSVDGDKEDVDGLLKEIDSKGPDIVFPRKNVYSNPRKNKWAEKIGTSYISEHLLSCGIPVIGCDGNQLKLLRNKSRCDIVFSNAGASFLNDFILIDPNGKGRPYGKVINRRGFGKSDLEDPFKKYSVLFIKPNSGGRSTGITDENVLHSLDELVERAHQLGEELGNNLLIINPFYPGKEYTVGAIGNFDKKILLPVEVFQTSGYSKNQILLKDVKRKGIPSGKVGIKRIDNPALTEELLEASSSIFKMLGINDYTRIDFRQDENGRLYAIDINGIPGLKHRESYISMAAEMAFSGQKESPLIYGELISSVVSSAAQRFNLPYEGFPTLFGLQNKLFGEQK